jgi:hypothetical protein
MRKQRGQVETIDKLGPSKVNYVRCETVLILLTTYHCSLTSAQYPLLLPDPG